MDTLSIVQRALRRKPLYCIICKEQAPNSRSVTYCAECRDVLDRIQHENDHRPFPYIRERVEALAAHTARIHADIAAGKAVA